MSKKTKNDAGKEPLTHSELVKRAGTWLRTNKWHIVATERSTICQSEIPDAIGFASSGQSCLIECKVSRADFLRDRDKPFRHHPERGMGDVRYYLAPKGLISEDELPEGWGLIEAQKTDYGYIHVRTKKESTEMASNKNAEVGYLTSMIRRLEISATVFIQQESVELTNEDPILSLDLEQKE